MPSLSRYFPPLDWGRNYSRATLTNDLVAAVIVTIMLIPQSLAYALLAGLPAQAGIYASIVPIVLYALFGTSRALAVGPVAVVSLMTAAAIGQVAEAATPPPRCRWRFCQARFYWRLAFFGLALLPISSAIR
jgi:SulP family sulfate permease